ncbi:MAG: hypothetical protein ABJH68_11355 [Ilumatobacter sp.]|uniref:hypothetical protein n=1 Tax=Ilumatobacter sp. TaxID=1967498 RepID=UPI003298C6D1
MKRPTGMDVQSRTAVCLLSLALVACGSSDPVSEPSDSGSTSPPPAGSDGSTTAPPAETLAEQMAGRWYVVAVDGVAVDPTRGDFWSFRGTDTALGISGFDGCNNISTIDEPGAAYASIVDGHLENLELVGTERGCEDGISGPSPRDGAEVTVSDDGTLLTLAGPSATIELSRTPPGTG